MSDEKTKAAILARRARFIAAAMMGAGVMSCEKKPADPVVCLSIALEAPPDAAPAPCLSEAPTPKGPPDAGAAITDAGAPDPSAVDAGAADAGTEPRPCLKVVPTSKARPCLKAPRICLDSPQ